MPTGQAGSAPAGRAIAAPARDAGAVKITLAPENCALRWPRRRVAPCTKPAKTPVCGPAQHGGTDCALQYSNVAHKRRFTDARRRERAALASHTEPNLVDSAGMSWYLYRNSMRS